MGYLKDRFLLLKHCVINAANLPNQDKIKLVVARQITKQRLQELAYRSKELGITHEKYSNKDVIVSLTTHGKRIMTVHRAIESIMQQSVLPNRIVLYIGNQELDDANQLPVVIRRQMSRGLEVRFVPDEGPYTKLLPALREFPDSLIITVDDDNMYPFNTIERLIAAHNNHPDAICSLATRILQRDKSNRLIPYSKCPFLISPQDSSSPMYVAEGCGGVLYPPNAFSDEVFRRDRIELLSPKADDLWFKVMSLLNDTPVVGVHSFFDCEYERYWDDDVQDIGLGKENLFQGENDIQLRALLDYYHLDNKLT